MAAVRERFTGALQVLRNARFGARGRHGLVAPARPTPGRALPLPDAVVHDHRRTRHRQDDGAAQRRAAVSAGRAHGRAGGARRRRHAQLRLVVHRPRGADRHRRPLHHARQRPGQRQGHLGGLPEPAEALAAASAAQRRAGHGGSARPDHQERERAPPPCADRARARAGAARATRRAAADLPAGHQVRPDGRLCRDLRRARQGAARHALGLHLRARRARGPDLPERTGARVRRACCSACRSAPSIACKARPTRSAACASTASPTSSPTCERR